MRTQLRHLWREVDDRLGDRPAPPLLSVSQTLGVVRRELISDKPPRADSFDKYKICDAGDVVLNRFNAYRGSLGVSNERGIVSPDYLVLRADRNSHASFLDYLLRSEELSNFMKSTMGGLGASDPDVSGFSRIDVGSLGQYSVPTFDFRRQQEIAFFLDRETAQIDELIGKQERLIELLTEKRQAIITHAVTRGLDPTAPTKPSGVTWLENIPRHWTAPRLAWESDQIVDGTHFTPTYVDEGVPFLRVTDIHTPKIDLQSVARIPQTEHADLTRRCRPAKGDLLLSKNGTIGVPRAVTWDWDFSIFVSLCLIKLRPSMLAEFAEYVFLSSAIKSQIDEGTKQSTVSNLHLEKIRQFRIPLPPLSEQQQVIEYLQARTGKIDSVTERAKMMVARLLERRSALISAAVTGKIDVRKGVA